MIVTIVRKASKSWINVDIHTMDTHPPGLGAQIKCVPSLRSHFGSGTALWSFFVVGGGAIGTAAALSTCRLTMLPAREMQHWGSDFIGFLGSTITEDHGT